MLKRGWVNGGPRAQKAPRRPRKLSPSELAEKVAALPASERREFPRELIDSLPQLVESLSPASRAVVVLFYLHELSLVETAAVLEIPIGTAKSRLAYGLEKLRRSFEEKEN